MSNLTIRKRSREVTEEKKTLKFSRHCLARTFARCFYLLLNVAFRPLTKKYLTVFLFHEVTDSPSKFQKQALNYTSTKDFENCIEWILRNYEILSVNHLFTCIKSQKKPLAVITFDDAWRGQFGAIKKITTEKKIPVIYFINMGAVQSGFDITALKSFYKESTPSFHEFTSRENRFRAIENSFLDWQGEIIQVHEVNELLGNSLVTIGNHGYHHFPSTELSAQEFFQNVELNEQTIDGFKTNSKHFAFPHGRPFLDFDMEHVLMLYRKGYKHVFAGDGRLNKLSAMNPHYISRVHFAPSDSKSSDFWWAANKSIIMRRN
jgi:peptidoglycan/xylan/chitin deacetylase (PgdA/CDA1 family)